MGLAPLWPARGGARLHCAALPSLSLLRPPLKKTHLPPRLHLLSPPPLEKTQALTYSSLYPFSPLPLSSPPQRPTRYILTAQDGPPPRPLPFVPPDPSNTHTLCPLSFISVHPPALRGAATLWGVLSRVPGAPRAEPSPNLALPHTLSPRDDDDSRDVRPLTRARRRGHRPPPFS